MKKRILALFLTLVMLLGMMPTVVLAAGPKEISSQDQLREMANAAGEYKLTADITLSEWTSIDLQPNTTFDGNGHTITLNGASLFGEIEERCTISNLVLDGAVEGDSDVGALAKHNRGTVRSIACYTDVTCSNGDYVAGLIGQLLSSSSISNCLYAGTLEKGSAKAYGAIANAKSTPKIEYCIGVGSDRVGSKEGFDENFDYTIVPIKEGNNKLIISPEQFSPDEHIDHFNNHLQQGDLTWEVVNGRLQPKPSEETTPENSATEDKIKKLTDAIASAENVDKTILYTADTWAAFTSALGEAQEIDLENKPEQSTVLDAADKLNDAKEKLLPRTVEGTEIPAEGVVEVNQSNFKTHLKDPKEGTVYQLMEDIVLDKYWFSGTVTMNSVLDGNGHTITLGGTPIWGTIGSDGVIQNLGVQGHAQNGSSDTGALAEDCKGFIINCWSHADVNSEGANSIRKNTGGLVANLMSGGAIVNSYVAGSVSAKGNNGNGAVGALTGTAQENSLIQTSYWLSDVNSNPAGSSQGLLKDNASKNQADFHSQELIELLNTNKGEYGKTWTINNEGWPHLGENGDYVPPEAVTLAFTNYKNPGSAPITFQNTDGLTLPLSEVLSSGREHVGRFSYPDYQGTVVWVPQYGTVKNVFVDENGEMQVLGSGSLEVIAYDKASWSGTQYETELTRFKITIEEIQAEELRLVPTGKYVTEENGVYTVAGSGSVAVIPQIKVNGEWKESPAKLFSFVIEGSISGSRNTFYATRPGVVTVRATGLGQSASVTVTSTYVPVSKISPAPNGTYAIHERNANSNGMGDFLDLTLSHQAGSILIQPENASYSDAWSITSSDQTIAEFISSMIVGILPYKAGTVTLTATATDPQQSQPVTGSSTITLEYLNPLTKVTAPTEPLTVKENVTIDLPLTFEGPKSGEGYHVTEPDMVWSFTGDGAVEIGRDTPGLLIREEGTGGHGEYCVANPNFKLTGTEAGTVIVTGTPVDTTRGAKPVTFTVIVEAGETEKPIDTQIMGSTAQKKAQDKLQSWNAGKEYVYGSEWELFALTRSSATIDPIKIENYLNSVKKTYENPATVDLKPTTVARVALAVTALGEDASNLDGLNLIEMLCNNAGIGNGSNEPMWALIALDCRDYAVPETGKWSRDKLVSEVISKYQNVDNGGFGLTDKITTSVDMTAMAVQALAPYYETRVDVKQSVDKALVYLQKNMDRNCRFESSESGAQVIIALGALGKDPVDPQNGFVRSGARNLITGLTSFQMADGSFKHLMGDKGGQKMSTIQALCALESYRRITASENALYDLTDLNIQAVLTARIAEANGLNKGDYTEDTWNAMQTTLIAAKTVLEQTKPKPTEEELKAADRALSNAIAALKRVSALPVEPIPPIEPDKPQDTITVSFRLIGDSKHGGGIAGHTKYVNWIPTCDVVVPKGATVFDAFDIAIKNHGMDYKEGQESYISAIKAPRILGGYWLGEFDNGPNSGWKYMVNGEYPGVGLRYYWLEDGDSIIWRYVNDYTDEEDNTTKWKEAEDIKVSPDKDTSKPESGTALTPEITADKKGEVKVELDKKAMEKAITRAGKNQMKQIVIEPDITGKLNTLTVNLPTQSMKGVAKETNAALEIQCKLGVVTIPNEAVRSISAQAKKNTISINIEKKSMDDVKKKLGDKTPKDAEILEVTVLSGDQSISTFGGHELTIQIPANAKLHKERESYQVIVISSDGTVEVMSGKCMKTGGKLAVQVATPHLSTFVMTGQKFLPFEDVTGHWAQDAIQYVYSQGFMKGTEINLFSPDTPLSRAMMVSILYRKEGAPRVGAVSRFPDVQTGDWYADAVIWAETQGIVSGTDGGKFAPDDPITREEMAVLLHRYARYKQYDVSRANTLNGFHDAKQVGFWAVAAMEWANTTGLITGQTPTTIDPQGTATRAEAATVLMRLSTLFK